MYQKPTVPQSIGGVLDDTLQLFKASLSKCVLPALLISVITTSLSLFQLSRQPVATTPAATFQAFVARYQSASPSSFLLVLLSWLLELVFYGILIVIIADVSRGASPALGTSIATALKRLPAMVGASIVIFIVSIIGFGIAVVPVIVAAVRSRGGTPTEVLTAVGPMILLCLVLIFPVIYVLSRMQLFLVPLASEAQGPLRSIGISWRLVGGNWWRTATVVFILGIIVYILIIVVSGLAGGIALMVAGVPASATRAAGTVGLVEALMSGLIQVITAPLMAALYVTLYQDLLLRKGGSDLEARLGALPKG